MFHLHVEYVPSRIEHPPPSRRSPPPPDVPPRTTPSKEKKKNGDKTMQRKYTTQRTDTTARTKGMKGRYAFLANKTKKIYG